jgi:hypothetical protein
MRLPLVSYPSQISAPDTPVSASTTTLRKPGEGSTTSPTTTTQSQVVEPAIWLTDDLHVSIRNWWIGRRTTGGTTFGSTE